MSILLEVYIETPFIFVLLIELIKLDTERDRCKWDDKGHTIYPKKYAHGFCFAVLCCGYTLTDFPIMIRLTSLALWQSNNCPSASKATLMNMDKYFMWIHYDRLHNQNKAKHNKTVCIFLGIYCRFISNDHFPPTILVACPSVGIISILPAPIIVCRDTNWHGSHIILSHCPENIFFLWLCIAYWENNLILNRHIHGSFHYRPFWPALWAVCNGVSQNLA